MTDEEKLAVFCAGSQTRIDVPARPKALPEAIRNIKPKTEQKRAQTAWVAACRLQLVIKLWLHFLAIGMLRSRLDDATESAIIAWFPELQDMGGVLNTLAEAVEWKAEVAQELPAFDELLGIKREPTARHQDDDPKRFGPRTIKNLLETFLRLMHTNADCLCLLDLNKDEFRRPWPELRADLTKLVWIDMEVNPGEPPHLDFGNALSNLEFHRIRSRLLRALRELVEQLVTYPEAVLRRPNHEPQASGVWPGSLARCRQQEGARLPQIPSRGQKS